MMAGWDDLTKTKKMQLARQLAAGRNDAANINRAMAALSENPALVARVAKEAGIEDEIDALEEMSVDDKVDNILRPKIPEPKKDETMRDYVARLQKKIDAVDRGGDDDDQFEDPIFGQSKPVEAEL